MKIDRKLNLVCKVDTEALGEVHVHSTPIGRIVYEEFYRVIGRALNQIGKDDMLLTGGSSYAYLTLKDVATQMGIWEVEGNAAKSVKVGLLEEIVRLTTVIYLDNKQGWQQMPLATAKARKLLTEEDVAQVEGQLVFFTLVVSVMPRNLALMTLTAATGFWGSQLTASSATEWQSSLTTSTAAGSTGETPITASEQRLPM